MEIANIVSKEKLNLGSEFNVVQSIDEIVFGGLPTLIVGYDLMKEIYGEDVELDFMERKFKDNIFWTFTKKERRKLYNADMEDFIQYSFTEYVSKINYVFVDPIQYSYTKLRKIIYKLYRLNSPISYMNDNDMVYIFSDGLIFGINLALTSFLGFDKDKILNKIKTKSEVFLMGEELLIEYNNYMERLDFDTKYIPFIYSMSKYD